MAYPFNIQQSKRKSDRPVSYAMQSHAEVLQGQLFGSSFDPSAQTGPETPVTKIHTASAVYSLLLCPVWVWIYGKQPLD